MLANTKPFAFEGSKRMKQAEKSLLGLAGSVGTLVVPDASGRIDVILNLTK